MSDPDADGPAAGADALWDVGAQSERTALAWQRSSLSLALAGAVLIGNRAGQLSAAWPGVLIMVAGGLAATLVPPLRYRRTLRAVRGGRSPAGTVMVPAAAGLVVLVACVAAVTLATG